MLQIKVCTWIACLNNFSNYITIRIKRDIEKFDLKNINIEKSNCMGMCKKWPNVKIDNKIMKYTNASKVSEAIFKKIK